MKRKLNVSANEDVELHGIFLGLEIDGYLRFEPTASEEGVQISDPKLSLRTVIARPFLFRDPFMGKGFPLSLNPYVELKEGGRSLTKFAFPLVEYHDSLKAKELHISVEVPIPSGTSPDEWLLFQEGKELARGSLRLGVGCNFDNRCDRPYEDALSCVSDCLGADGVCAPDLPGCDPDCLFSDGINYDNDCR